MAMATGEVEGLSKSQAARMLGLSSARVDQLMTAGRLPYCTTALGRLLDPEAVQAMKVQREREARLKDSDKS